MVDYHEQCIHNNDTGYGVFNNPGFQTYSIVGGDRAVLSGIMPIVTSAVHILRMLGLSVNYVKFPVEQSLGVKWIASHTYLASWRSATPVRSYK